VHHKILNSKQIQFLQLVHLILQKNLPNNSQRNALQTQSSANSRNPKLNVSQPLVPANPNNSLQTVSQTQPANSNNSQRNALQKLSSANPNNSQRNASQPLVPANPNNSLQTVSQTQPANSNNSQRNALQTQSRTNTTISLQTVSQPPPPPPPNAQPQGFNTLKAQSRCSIM